MYITKKLGEFATFERAKKDEIYKSGTVAIQVSATQGEIIYLEKDSTIEVKYVIIHQDECLPKYLYYFIKKTVQQFLTKYKSGLNIQIKDLDFFEIKIHDKKIQKKLIEALDYIEKEIEIAKKQEEHYKEFKKKQLKNMLV